MTPAQHCAEIVAWLESGAVLTPEQRAEYEKRLAAYKSQRQEEMEFKHGR